MAGALARVRRALVPGGYVVFGLSPRPPDPLREALANLRTLRSGGHRWTEEVVGQLLREAGFQSVETARPRAEILLVLGRVGAELALTMG
jgi:hypothetical protein